MSPAFSGSLQVVVNSPSGLADVAITFSLRAVMEAPYNAAARVAGLGKGFSGHNGRVEMAQDLVKCGVELPALMTAGRMKSSAITCSHER